MPWRDELLPASFRGAAFEVPDAGRSGGRRNVKHEFPFQDKPYIEDIGMKGREFQFEGFVLGPDYKTSRDALLTALESGSGPGTLIHPHYGTLRVAVLTYHVREESSAGGMAKFTMEFAEAPADSVQPTVAIDSAGAAQDASSNATDAAQAQFLNDFVPGTRTESLAGALLAVHSTVSGALLGVSLATSAPLLASVSVSLIRSPADLFDALSVLVGSFRVGAESVLTALYNFNPGVRPPSTTPDRVQEQACFDALQFGIQRLCVSQLAFIATETAFDSYDAAVTERDSITCMIDQLADAVSDDTYPAFVALRAAVVQAVPGAADLPRLISYTPPVTVPSLVLAHRLYGPASLEVNELALVARNPGVSDPSLVQGGEPLEVLTDAD